MESNQKVYINQISIDSDTYYAIHELQIGKNLQILNHGQKIAFCYFKDNNYYLNVITKDSYMMKSDTSVKSISTQIQASLISFRLIFNDKQRIAVAKWNEGWVEFINFESQKTILRDFKKFSTNFIISIFEDNVVLINQDSPSFIQLSFKKVQKIIENKQVQLKVYGFKSMFKSIQTAKVIKKTKKKTGEAKAVIYGIADKDSFFKAQFVHNDEKKKIGYQIYSYASSWKSKLMGYEDVMKIRKFHLNIEDHLKKIYKEDGRNFQGFMFLPTKKPQLQNSNQCTIQEIDDILIIENCRIYIIDHKNFVVQRVFKGQRDSQISHLNKNYLVVLLTKRNILEVYDLKSNMNNSVTIPLEKFLKLQLQQQNEFPILIDQDLGLYEIDADFMSKEKDLLSQLIDMIQ